MSDDSSYVASHIEYEPRRRATVSEMQERAKFIIAYAEEHGPITVRGLYYQAEVASVPGITKDEGDYNKIQRQVLLLRRSGELSYEHIADATRWMRKPTTFNSVEHILQSAAATYRKALWTDAKDYVEIWCEKDALAGVIYPVTSLNDVPLMITRGYSSETFAYEAIAARGNDPRTFHVYYLGDFDRAGQDASNSLCEKLYRFAKGKPFEVKMYDLAVTEQQIRDWNLSTRPPKRKTAADQNWPQILLVSWMPFHLTHYAIWFRLRLNSTCRSTSSKFLKRQRKASANYSDCLFDRVGSNEIKS